MLQKIILLIIIVLPCLFFQTGCSTKPYGIKFDTETIDLGTLNTGESKDVVFKFKNTGSEILKIWEIRPTCGCLTTGEWDQEIKPGKRGAITIKFHTQAYRGNITRVVYIKTNVPERSSIQLTIKVFIYHILEINPRNVYMGDILDITKPVTRSFDIVNNQGFPLTSDQITVPENVKFNLITKEPDTKYLLEFTIYPPFIKEKEVTEKIFIKVGAKRDQTITLEYSYFVPPPIQVNPKEIKLNMIKVKEEKIDWRINIKSNIDKPIKVLEPKFDGSGADFFVDELLKDKFYQIAVIFPRGFTFPDDKKVFYVSFKVLNDPKGLLYTIPIQAEEAAQ